MKRNPEFQAGYVLAKMLMHSTTLFICIMIDLVKFGKFKPVELANVILFLILAEWFVYEFTVPE